MTVAGRDPWPALPSWWWLQPSVTDPEAPALIDAAGRVFSRRQLAAAVCSSATVLMGPGTPLAILKADLRRLRITRVVVDPWALPAGAGGWPSPLTHANLLAAAQAVGQVLALGPEDRSLAPTLLGRLEAVFQVPELEADAMTEAATQICSNRLPGTGPERLPGSGCPPVRSAKWPFAAPV